MRHGTASSAPAGWLVARVVDSRLEADLGIRILQRHGIDALVVARGEQDFAICVPPDQLSQAAGTLECG